MKISVCLFRFILPLVSTNRPNQRKDSNEVLLQFSIHLSLVARIIVEMTGSFSMGEFKETLLDLPLLVLCSHTLPTAFCSCRNKLLWLIEWTFQGLLGGKQQSCEQSFLGFHAYLRRKFHKLWFQVFTLIFPAL